jgi:hypothetical protein
MSEDINIKIKALAAYFKVAEDKINDEGGGDYTIDSEPGEYRVLTDEEADAAWDEYLESYLDDCVLSELPELARNYFDAEKWKRDAQFDGRGHCLSPYDGNEHEIKIDDEWIYIYRTN